MSAFLELKNLDSKLKKISNDNPSVPRVIQFRVGGEDFISPLKNIFALSTLSQITPIPGTKKWVQGLMSFHGEIILVLNFAQLCNLESKSTTNLSRIIIIKHKDEYYGILADEILGINKLNLNNYPARNRNLCLQSWLGNKVKLNNNYYTILDFHKMFILPEFRKITTDMQVI